jgi:plasmid stabilization system protein ParE
VRRSFDAVRPIVQLGSWTWNGMLAKLVAIENGVFDDGHEPGQTFGGFGFIRLHRSRPGSGMSGYYLRLRRERAPFDQGDAREVRHTVGSRTWGRRAAADYNYEAIFQWGSFGDAPIRAWALATETGYDVRLSRWPMRVAVRADLTSGDRRLDSPLLQTFNPLFPGTAYSGRTGLVGPANSIDVTPSVRLTPVRRLALTVDHTSYWRQSVHDGLYGIAVNLVRRAGESRARDVGRQLSVQADVPADGHLTFGVTVTAFLAGRFLRETGPGRNVRYAAVNSTYRF